jgi:hypothetical protein
MRKAEDEVGSKRLKQDCTMYHIIKLSSNACHLAEGQQIQSPGAQHMGL